MAFIYKIVNDINKKIYIGKTSRTIEERFKEHCKDALKNHNEKRPLYFAMRCYGIKHFKIEYIEECLPEEAAQREQYWIQYYNSYINGYNATLGGDGKYLFNHSQIAEKLKKHPYPKDIAKEFSCSTDLIYIIAKEFNIKVFNRGQEENVNSKKQISQFTKDGHFIQSFNSTSEAAIWCFNNQKCATLNSGVRGHIGECANGKRKSAYGYIWKYF